MVRQYQFNNLPLQPQPPDENADSDGEDEIYRGILATQIKLVKGFSLTTSLISLSCQPVLYYTLQVQFMKNNLLTNHVFQEISMGFV